MPSACRKRRIRCDEGKPICGNCTKSKRHCEGYNQRVVFKSPISVWTGAVSSSSSAIPRTGPSSSFSSRSSFSQNAQAPPSSQASLPSILPKPTASFSSYSVPGSSSSTFPESPKNNFDGSDLRTYSRISGTNEGQRASDGPPQQSPNYDTQRHPVAQQYLPTPPLPTPSKESVHYNFDAAATTDPVQNITNPSQENGETRLDRPPRAFELSSQENIYNSDMQEAAQTAFTQSFQGSVNWGVRPGQDIQPNFLPKQQDTFGFIQAESEPNGLQYTDQKPLLFFQQESNNSQDARPRSSFHQKQDAGFIVHQTTHSGGYEVPPGALLGQDLQFLPNAEDEEDEDWDVSDGEFNNEEYDHDPEIGYGEVQQSHLRNNDLGALVSIQASQDRQDQRLRTYHSVIDDFGPNMLVTYHPSSGSSPLNDPITARIFCHFINVLGPSISMYERHPTNPSLMFQGQPVPASLQHIWSCTSA